MKKSKATEALRVATEIAVIKAALHKRGYRLLDTPRRKRTGILGSTSPLTII